MKVAVIWFGEPASTRWEDYLPKNAREILFCGAAGVAEMIEQYARIHHIRLTDARPWSLEHTALEETLQILGTADQVLVFADEISTGTKLVMQHCIRQGLSVQVILLPN